MRFLMVTAALAWIMYSVFLVYKVWNDNKPNEERIAFEHGGLEVPIYYRGELYEISARGEGEALQLPLQFIQQYIDPYLTYEESESGSSVILTTKDRVIRFKTDQLTAYLNEEPMTLRYPVEVVDEIVYMPIEPLREYYGIRIIQDAETGVVHIMKQGDAVQQGVIAAREERDEPAAIRSAPSIKAPIYADLQDGEEVIIWGERDGWYIVQQANGIKGYVNKSDIQLAGIVHVSPVEREVPNVPFHSLGGKVNLTWENVTAYGKTNTSAIGDMPGLNVVSPTWFHLKNGDGDLENLADHNYVRWAHGRGYQVWALFSNSFDPDITTEALADYDTRMKMIKQLLAYAELYDLQGINIDFENVYLKDKDKLTQFVRELTPLAHEQGLVISIDVTVRGGSEMWSLFLDRKALGETVDYMILMGYDEHWASSPVAGSVASLGWAEKGIKDIMTYDGVPASKMILGVPFYTRLWAEEVVDGKKKVSSRALYMSGAQNIIKEKGLTPVFDESTGQNYVSYEENGITYKMWIEDEVSMRARAEIVKRLDLAGIASWRRGFETPNIWGVIEEVLRVKPN
jgi:spore germination protein YaaH/SH3-like domain-containing protein